MQLPLQLTCCENHALLKSVAPFLWWLHLALAVFFPPLLLCTLASNAEKANGAAESNCLNRNATGELNTQSEGFCNIRRLFGGLFWDYYSPFVVCVVPVGEINFYHQLKHLKTCWFRQNIFLTVWYYVSIHLLTFITFLRNREVFPHCFYRLGYIRLRCIDLDLYVLVSADWHLALLTFTQIFPHLNSWSWSSCVLCPVWHLSVAACEQVHTWGGG